MNFRKIIALCLLGFVLTATVLPSYADDTVEEEEDGRVDDETVESEKASVTPTDKDKDAEEQDDSQIKPSPDVETVIHFTKPVNKQELPAGALVKFLIGFTNRASQDMIVQSIQTSFRYPMDFNFFIRNYTDAFFHREVSPNTESTFDYAFFPAEDLAGRPFGLTVLLNYKDANGTVFQSAAFNETVTIVEDESGFNPETVFLYIFLACLVVLLLLFGQQFLQKMRKKHGMTKKQRYEPRQEMGTSSNGDVDWEWIPKEVLNMGKQSPKPAGSPKHSPRQRKQQKKSGNTSGSD